MIIAIIPVNLAKIKQLLGGRLQLELPGSYDLRLILDDGILPAHVREVLKEIEENAITASSEIV